jgi:hypothetical protein
VENAVKSTVMMNNEINDQSNNNDRAGDQSDGTMIMGQ